MMNKKSPSMGRYLQKILFIFGYLTIVFICILFTQATLNWRSIPFGVALLVASVLIIVGYSIALFDSWLNPLQFQQRESASAKKLASRNKFYRLITITNEKFLLWWWRLISPLMVVIGLLLFKLAISLLYG
jgi:hypothetical protein